MLHSLSFHVGSDMQATLVLSHHSYAFSRPPHLNNVSSTHSLTPAQSFLPPNSHGEDSLDDSHTHIYT